MNNIPVVKLGLIAVTRDCFPIELSEKRRAAIMEAYKGELYECPVTVENEKESRLTAINPSFTTGILFIIGIPPYLNFLII